MYLRHLPIRHPPSLPCPQSILVTFKQFYSSLYASTLLPDFHPGEPSVLLGQIALGWLSGREIEAFIRSITSEEIQKAKSTFPSGKTPGPDGKSMEIF